MYGVGGAVRGWISDSIRGGIRHQPVEMERNTGLDWVWAAKRPGAAVISGAAGDRNAGSRSVCAGSKIFCITNMDPVGVGVQISRYIRASSRLVNE